MPCMRSCLGVKVPRPGVRGAEGQGKRQGITVRWGLKAVWNEGAGRGTRTGDEVWYALGTSGHATTKSSSHSWGVLDTSGVDAPTV